jgi:hypothetical protein
MPNNNVDNTENNPELLTAVEQKILATYRRSVLIRLGVKCWIYTGDERLFIWLFRLSIRCGEYQLFEITSPVSLDELPLHRG